jgi:hypothetical protein
MVLTATVPGSKIHLGRPPKGEEEDPEAAVLERRGREELGPDWRPCYEANDIIARGVRWLGVDVEDLLSRRRNQIMCLLFYGRRRR